eukprot:gene36799-44642_t
MDPSEIQDQGWQKTRARQVLQSGVENSRAGMCCQLSKMSEEVKEKKPCPFWNEFGQCAMEACTVCTCDEKEVPSAWVYGVNRGEKGDFGWVSNQGSVFGYDGDESLGKVTVSTAEQSTYDSPPK